MSEAAGGDGNVVKFSGTRRLRGGGGNGGDFDTRLRSLEVDVARIDERLVAIQENMAKKNDVTTLKVWILGGALSGIFIAVPIAVTVAKAFLGSAP